MKLTYPIIAMAALLAPATAQARSTAEDKLPAEPAPPPALTVGGSAASASGCRSDLRPSFSRDQEGAGDSDGSTILACRTAAF